MTVADLTPAVLQIIPRGLLGFLGLKNGGRNPSRLAEFVQPTFELFNYYFETNSLNYQLGPVAGAGVGDGDFSAVSPAVAQDECRYVSRYTVRALVPAGTTWSVAPAIQVRTNPAGARSSYLVGPPVRHTGGAAQELVMAPADRPFWMPPDSLFGFVTLAYTGAGAVPVYFTSVQAQFKL